MIFFSWFKNSLSYRFVWQTAPKFIIRMTHIHELSDILLLNKVNYRTWIINFILQWTFCVGCLNQKCVGLLAMHWFQYFRYRPAQEDSVFGGRSGVGLVSLLEVLFSDFYVFSWQRISICHLWPNQFGYNFR